LCDIGPGTKVNSARRIGTRQKHVRRNAIQQKKSNVRMYSQRVTPSVPVSPASPPISSTSATPETARPTPPLLLLPPQPEQPEEDRRKTL